MTLSDNSAYLALGNAIGLVAFAKHEWVVVLKGRAQLTFESGEIVEPGVGDHINISAHAKHKVSRTDPENETVWVAVFYS